ncbi:MAG: hypothetical protein A6F71_02950 [Cycloclasticus sp. symbiont of Poecilosclerida sp. M]|nr:MAG: hypothetical protein A6F71_02950 [Cycloclasticus sp. symbiont of Poecilosclerida sp. M]
MRLENLFFQKKYFSQFEEEPARRSELCSVLDILSLAKRSDFKAELTREINRIINVLSPLLESPDVDHKRLEKTIFELKDLIAQFSLIQHKIGQKTSDLELLKSLTQRNSLSSGPCSFDLPAYHHWLNRPASHLREEINEWYNDLNLVEHTIQQLLQLIRNSALSTAQQALSGYYQADLELSRAPQLIRISLHKSCEYYAEISGGKHHFGVQFMEPNDFDRSQQTNKRVDFRLTICQL